MKRNYLLTGLCALLLCAFAACSTVKGLTNADKKGFTGTWTLSNISFDGIPANTKFKATVFDDVSYTCLSNSTWTLPGNGNGSYSVSSSDAECNPGVRNIVWSVEKAGNVSYFQFKHAEGGVKPKNITTGYRMEVSAVTATTLTLRSPINFEGNTVYIIYNFVK
ncbi:lipocalin family protein [Deminuibacter soli]|nr:lipocalin family protein [Deminuibacter soli]